MKQRPVKNTLIKRGLIILGLILVIYLLMIFAGYPHAVEHYYSKGFYQVLCKMLHTVFNVVPFSFGDILYIAVVIYLIYLCIRLIALCIRKKFMQALVTITGIGIGLLSGIIVFYVFWGLNYFRPSAGARLNLRDTAYTKTELLRVTNILIDSANVTRNRVTTADLKQPNDSIYNIAIQAVSKLAVTSAEFKIYSPYIKPSLLSSLLNYIGTSGYYNPFTGEAQMNYQMPVFNRPFVACHEMSHQMGYGAEDEANFAGFLAATGSNNRLLRYSAYNLAVNEFMRTVRYTDTVAFKQLKTRISKPVLADFKEERLYWQAYQNKLETFTSIFYDNFLKANNQPEGLETYNRMVLLVLAKYKANQ